MWVNIIQLRVNEKQSKKIDRSKVEKHRKHLEMGGDMFPIDVVKINEEEHCICGNGRHRYYGALEAGVQFIDVNVLN